MHFMGTSQVLRQPLQAAARLLLHLTHFSKRTISGVV